MNTLWSRIDKSNANEIAQARWVRASWLFGLRPSELDRCIETEDKDELTDFINGIQCLVAVQTRTVNKDGSYVAFQGRELNVCEAVKVSTTCGWRRYKHHCENKNPFFIVDSFF